MTITSRIWLSLLLLVLLLAYSTAATAQSTTRPTYNALIKVQELMEEQRLDEALAELEVLHGKTLGKPYDHAITNQYMAHISVMQGDMSRARRALSDALAMPGLPEALLADLNLFYGTVLLGEEEFELAQEALEGWLATATNPQPNQLFSVAYANFLAGDAPRAQELIERAFDGTSGAPERWYQVYYQILMERKLHDDGERVLLGLLERHTGNGLYWRMLANHHMQLERSHDALASVMVAYVNDLLTGKQDLEQIVSLFGYIDAPERGATLLEEWMQNETLPTDIDSLNQLANLWLLARERQKAKEVLLQATELGADTRTFRLLGGVYFEDEQWVDAYEVYRKAMRSEDLQDPEYISMLAGISAFNAGMNEEAKVALLRASESPEYAPQIESFLKQLN
ncbi:MAG: hypothetical protein KJO31_06475 [Gammaproteobacteria bacterium]|nr:hypothetical protein [Gammaproteobacteria bacterium]